MLTPAKQLISAGRWCRNLVLNHGFEGDFTGWALSSGSSTPTIITSGALFGSKCLHTVQSASFPSYAYQDIVVPNGHKVYFAGCGYFENWTSGVLEVSLRDYGVFTNVTHSLLDINKLNTWQKLSGIKTVSNGGVRVLVGRGDVGAENSRFDGIMVVDLTAEFGAGNEPTKAWCDTYLQYAGDMVSVRPRGFVNLVLNGDFSNGYTNWTLVDAVVNGIAEKTATVQYAAIRQDLAVPSAFRSHKIYAAALIKADSSGVALTVTDGVLATGTAHSGSNNFERLSLIKTIDASATTLAAKVQDNRASAWTKYYCDYYMLIDLTAEFGVGFEPTQAWCDANIAPNIIW